jgi:hypothetical protein
MKVVLSRCCGSGIGLKCADNVSKERELFLQN